MKKHMMAFGCLVVGLVMAVISYVLLVPETYNGVIRIWCIGAGIILGVMGFVTLEMTWGKEK